MRWKNTGWLQSRRRSRKWFFRTEYNYCHKDHVRSLPTLGVLLLEGNNKAFSSIWHLCALQMRWVSSYPFLQVGKLRHRGRGIDLSAFPQENSPAALENEPSLSVSWSTAQSLRLLPLTEEELCAAAVASHAASAFADSLRFILPALTFLSGFRCFLFCCTARHFSTWRTLPFLFLPPLSSPNFSYVTNYLDSILIYKMYCQYHSGTLKTLPEQRCPFV